MSKNQLYYRLTCGFKDFGKLIPIEESVYNHIPDLNLPWFQSIYYYNEKQKQEAEEIIEIGGKGRPKGVAGITDVITNKLVFDFDHKDDIEKARKEAIALCERLMSHGVPHEAIQPSYSGFKGYGIEVVFEDVWFTPSEVKNIVSDLSDGLETIDTVITNASRIFRVPLTKHATSNLYKMPLVFDELKSVSSEQIKETADGSYSLNIPESWTTCKCPATFHTIKETPVEKAVKVSVVAGKEHKLDFNKMPKGFTRWKFALLNGYFPQGTRSNALMILGSTLRYLGYPLEIAHNMLKASIRMQSERFGQEPFSKEEMYQTVIAQVYGPSWRGACYSEDNFDQKLQNYLLECGIPKQRKANDNGLQSIDGVFGQFEDFAENIDANTIVTGIKALDDNCRITTGMLMGWLAAPGGGKTSTVLQILNNTSLNGVENIFFSLDMGPNLVYQRLVQKHMGYPDKQLFNIFKEKNHIEKLKIRSTLKKNYENVKFSFKTALTVDNISEQIIEHEETTSKKVKLVVIDYLETICGPFSDSTANSAYVANALKDLATNLDVCIILLLQTQKMGGNLDDPLRSLRKVKSSSVVEQSCSVIISSWRYGADPQNFENDKFITFCCCKNRMGVLFEVDCSWDGFRGEVFELSDNEREELENLKNNKAKKEAMKSMF